jgi:hypothetical protein
LWKGMKTLVKSLDTNPVIAAGARRVIEAVIAD